MIDTSTEAYRQWNEAIIAEFRANAGKVGGPFEGAPMVLLTTVGSKTGKRRTIPLVYAPDGERNLIFASKAGAPDNPSWFNNLVANPAVTFEIGTETFEGRAEVLQGEERDRLFEQQAARVPQFAEYQKNTSRVIPVVALYRT